MIFDLWARTNEGCCSKKQGVLPGRIPHCFVYFLFPLLRQDPRSGSIMGFWAITFFVILSFAVIGSTYAASKNGVITLGAAGILVIFWLIYAWRASWANYARQRDADWEYKLRILSKYIAPKVAGPAVVSNEQPPVTLQRAGWIGLRYGIVLGLGFGSVVWFGFFWKIGIDKIMLAMLSWGWFWHGRARGSIFLSRFAEDDLLDDFGIRCTIFGGLLGFGLGIVCGAGISFKLGVEWVSLLSVAWMLFWGTFGGGLKWEQDILGRGLEVHVPLDQGAQNEELIRDQNLPNEDPRYQGRRSRNLHNQALRNQVQNTGPQNQDLRLRWAPIGGFHWPEYVRRATLAILLLPWHVFLWALILMGRLLGLLWYLWVILYNAVDIRPAEYRGVAPNNANESTIPPDARSNAPVSAGPAMAPEERSPPRQTRAMARRQQQEEKTDDNT